MCTFNVLGIRTLDVYIQRPVYMTTLTLRLKLREKSLFKLSLYDLRHAKLRIHMLVAILANWHEKKTFNKVPI